MNPNDWPVVLLDLLLFLRQGCGEFYVETRLKRAMGLRTFRRGTILPPWVNDNSLPHLCPCKLSQKRPPKVFPRPSVRQSRH
ncbi:hypothetical protein SBDP2_640009 [Syntrophobacter sp. SbD2]|nr:hypothetical protein SBDP2_640009 [Syntrophobacter sp. SbD2]